MSEASHPRPSGGLTLTSRGFAAESEAVATEPETEPLLLTPSRLRRVLVVGASGFVGRHLLGRLVSRGHEVRAACREPPPEDARLPGVEWRAADISRPADVEGLAEECDVTVHVAAVRDGSREAAVEGVHVAGTENLLREARNSGCRRMVFASVLGAAPDAGEFFRAKHLGELAVRESGLEFVIFRPSVIFGPGDHFTARLAAWVRRLPVIPVPENRRLRVQPVSVEDVADALLQAVEREDVVGRAFELLGPDPLGMSDLVRAVAEALRLRRLVLPFPHPARNGVLSLVGRMGLPVHLAREQGYLLRRRRSEEPRRNPLRATFQIEPMPFEEILGDYL